MDQLTNLQIKFLEGLCKGEKAFTSAAFLNKYAIGAAGNIKRIKETLETKEIIDITGKEISPHSPFISIMAHPAIFS